MKNAIFTIAAASLVAVGVQVAGSAAAASASGASPNATMIKVRIHLTGTLTEAPQMRVGRGRFTLSGATYTRVGGILTPSGAISDRGTFVDEFGGQIGPRLAYMRTLRGAKGTIWVTADRPKGNWIILKGWGRPGTRAYAGLHGIGQQRGLYRLCDHRPCRRTIDVTMTGTLSR